MRTFLVLVGSAVAAIPLACAFSTPVTTAPEQQGDVLRDDKGLLKEGSVVPEFTVKASDGKTYSVKSLTEKGPVYLVFVKQQCSANPYAIHHYNNLYKAYQGKVNFVAVINADEAGYKSWSNEFGGTYTALLDPEKSIIKSFGVKRSQYTYLINKEGKVEKVFAGFGKRALEELNASMAGTAGTAVASIDFSEAPGRTAFG